VERHDGSPASFFGVQEAREGDDGDEEGGDDKGM
jgi:hypothetical protein